jgi:hypothetical protein
MSSSHQDKGLGRKLQQRQVHRQYPGAFPGDSSDLNRKRKSREIISRGGQLEPSGKGPTRNDSFIINPTPPSHLSRREARRKAACDSSRSMLPEREKNSDNASCEDDDKVDSESMELPGAVPVPGMFSLSRQGVEINTHARLCVTPTSRSSFISEEGCQAEAIVAAHLVEDIEDQHRDKIRQQIYDEAEYAEVVDTKRQKKCFLFWTCLCLLILAGVGFGLGFALKPQQGELDNSLCRNSAPLFVGDVISGSVGNSGVSKISTCSPTKPNGEIKGRWFTFLGDGASMTASTCGSKTNFDSQISVYIGSSCESLSCVAFADNSTSCCSSRDWGCNNSSAEVTLSTTVGIVYFICVHGTNVEADATFELTLSPSAGTFVNVSLRVP